jgi:hypothetical protein
MVGGLVKKGQNYLHRTNFMIARLYGMVAVYSSSALCVNGRSHDMEGTRHGEQAGRESSSRKASSELR